MHERHLRTPRTARFYVLGEVTNETRELWVACHGYAQLARFFARPFTSIVAADRAIIVPEALNRYYFETAPGVHGPDARVAATWMTREDRDHEMADYIEYLDNLVTHVAGDVAPHVRITALGFSQGAATVSRWAARGRTLMHRVVLWGSGLPPELEPGPDLFQGASVVLAAGASDAFVSLARVRAEAARLEAAGMTCSVLEYDGGHRVETEALAELVSTGAR